MKLLEPIDPRRSEWLRSLLGLSNDQSPFPWQERLLEEFTRGSIPDALDIPTGLGKTSVIAIWTAARAAGAEVPRRLVYVVDRRAVVDQATAEAERVKVVVDNTPEIKAALKLTRALPISTLRGQYVDNREWLEDPSLPAIVVGTVDMIGSRLLFEGYRCSRKMRPYHAGLLGVDAVIVLDEAHLVPPFEAMVRALVQSESLKAQPAVRGAVPRSRVMALSATGRGAIGLFQLDRTDEEHEIVKRRLNARKHVRILPGVESNLLAETLASRAWKLTEGGTRGTRVVVFVDSRNVAQDVSEAIEKLANGEGGSKVAKETELFVGGRRVAERDEAAKRLTELGMIAGSSVKVEKPVFLIATSAGEVGVDLDADHAVLDLVEYERMVQRLGRVNRRGDGEATVCIIPVALDEKTKAALEKEEKIRAEQHRRDEGVGDEDDGDEDDAEDNNDRAPKKLKEDERSRVERWRRREATARAIRSLPLSDREHGEHDSYNGSPGAFRALSLSKEAVHWMDQGLTPTPLHPELSRAVVESWSMTSLEEHAGRPSVRPWLRGWVDEDPQTTLVWRTWLPRREAAEAFFEAAPAETAETLEVETTTVFDWVNSRIRHVAKAAEGTRGAGGESVEPSAEETDEARPPLRLDDVVLFVLDDRFHSYTLRQLNEFDKKQRDAFFRVMSGETVVLDARLGGLAASGVLNSKSDGASDVSEKLRLSFRVREVDQLSAVSGDKEWRIEATFVSRIGTDGEPVAWLVVQTDLNQQATTQDGRSTGREQALDEHQAFAERHARRIGESASLHQAQVDLLALAAVLHDEGKKAERWQRAFRAPVEKRPLGKTTSRPIQSILAGYRHELGSLFYAERDLRVAALASQDRDLVLHLIAAHHGFARPILRTDGFDEAPPSALVERARSIALRFARLERRWGPWGLAWWESLLRAADQAASRENDEGRGKRG